MPAAAPAPVRPAAITPVEAAPSSASSAPGAPAGAAPGSAPLNLYPYMMKNAPRQRSLSEMANEQLNGGRARDKLAEGVAEAEVPDCVSPNAGGSLLSIITIPIAAARGKCK